MLRRDLTEAGIAPEDVPHVFERFYRSERSRTREGNGVSGMGLGLAIARALVRAHGGDIQVESKESSGTTVRIFLPGCAAAQPILHNGLAET